MTRAQRGSMERKSDASARFANSAMAPAISTPVGPPPTTTKFRRRLPLVCVRLGLGALEREQYPAAQIGRVVDRLQAWRIGCPIIAEIGMLGAGCDDEIVERNAAAFGDHFLARRHRRPKPSPG